MKRSIGVAMLIAIVAFASGLLFAQAQVLGGDNRVLSGNDVGFRVEAIDASGVPMGRWVVKINGRWVETQPAPTVRRATN